MTHRLFSRTTIPVSRSNRIKNLPSASPRTSPLRVQRKLQRPRWQHGPQKIKAKPITCLIEPAAYSAQDRRRIAASESYASKDELGWKTI